MGAAVRFLAEPWQSGFQNILERRQKQPARPRAWLRRKHPRFLRDGFKPFFTLNRVRSQPKAIYTVKVFQNRRPVFIRRFFFPFFPFWVLDIDDSSKRGLEKWEDNFIKARAPILNTNHQQLEYRAAKLFEDRYSCLSGIGMDDLYQTKQDLEQMNRDYPHLVDCKSDRSLLRLSEHGRTGPPDRTVTPLAAESRIV